MLTWGVGWTKGEKLKKQNHKANKIKQKKALKRHINAARTKHVRRQKLEAKTNHVAKVKAKLLENYINMINEQFRKGEALDGSKQSSDKV